METWEIVQLDEEGAHEVARLFWDIVHVVNVRDYSREQLDAWAPEGDACEQRLAEKLLGQRAVGVRECGTLIGFGSLDDRGFLDMLYVNKDRQRQGIGSILVCALEREARQRGWRTIGVFSSITARPFFECMGYAWVSDNVVMRNGVELRNYRMKKSLG